MRKLYAFFGLMGIIMLFNACGSDGDPGHCFFSLDWEYYNDEYGVYYYEDNNPDVPDAQYIVANYNYDCYPGSYNYYYESEDPYYYYSYTGSYTLVQNPGQPGGLFNDGLDGTDTYFDLYLTVYGKKDLPADRGDRVQRNMQPGNLMQVSGDPVEVTERNWETSKNGWTLKVHEVVRVYEK